MPCDNDKKEHKCCHDFEESACPCANKKDGDKGHDKKEDKEHKGCGGHKKEGGCGGSCPGHKPS